MGIEGTEKSRVTENHCGFLCISLGLVLYPFHTTNGAPCDYSSYFVVEPPLGTSHLSDTILSHGHATVVACCFLWFLHGVMECAIVVYGV